MSDDSKLTMSSLFVFLRQKLLEAREKNDEKLFDELSQALYLIEDAAYSVNDRKWAIIADEMNYAISHILMGAEWKANIPTVEQIEDENYKP